MSAASPDPERLVMTLEELLERWRRPRDGTLVFTNGVFDILHAGHAQYLDAARRLGDALVVGVNSDASTRRLKGPARPVNPEHDRAYVLAALAAVDAVTIFEQDTPRELIAALVPDVLVKGGDYRPEEVVGREEVEAGGGRVVIMPLREGRSTTGIIQRIRREEEKQ